MAGYDDVSMAITMLHMSITMGMSITMVMPMVVVGCDSWKLLNKRHVVHKIDGRMTNIF